MFQRSLSLVIAALGALALAGGTVAQEKPGTNEALARAAVDQYMKAVKAKNLDDIMKTVDVPFYMDGKKNIKDQDELRKLCAKLEAHASYKIAIAYPYEELRTKLSKQDQELLKEVLAKGDYVLILEVVTANGGMERATIAVKIREGKAKVVGRGVIGS